MFEDVDLKNIKLPKEDEVLVIHYNRVGISKSEIELFARRIQSLIEQMVNEKPKIILLPKELEFEVQSEEETIRKLENIVKSLKNT